MCLSRIPQTSVAQNRVSSRGRPCPYLTLPYSSGPCPFWALPYSSAALGAAGLRPSVVPLDLDHHAPHGVQQKCLAFPYNLLNFAPQLLNIRSIVPLVGESIPRHPYFCYQTTNVNTSVFVSPKSGCLTAQRSDETL